MEFKGFNKVRVLDYVVVFDVDLGEGLVDLVDFFNIFVKGFLGVEDGDVVLYGFLYGKMDFGGVFGVVSSVDFVEYFNFGGIGISFNGF